MTRRGVGNQARGAAPSPLPAGCNRKRDHRNVRVKKPDSKVAYVQLVSRAAHRALGSVCTGAGGRGVAGRQGKVTLPAPRVRLPGKRPLLRTWWVCALQG